MIFEERLDVMGKVSGVKAISLLKTPSTVTIIDRSTIKKYTFMTVAEALAIVPGIDVLQTEVCI
ncbi:MAG: Plug domain-containing protein [Bacteroidales bacterium]|nr:Plug domain-containing protein [Bacteroidales bacterium]MBN2820328.1 Plug domain-containing protein [Bacteroidales bacterium]